MKKQQRIGLLEVYLLVLSAASVMAATPAGTQIQATGTAQYYSTDGSTMPPGNSNMVTTTVMQVASVSLTPTTDAKPGSAGSPVNFPLAVKNTGNGSDTFDLSVWAKNGSILTIYKDDNGDGVRQSTENTVVTSTGALPIGGTFSCIASAMLPSSVTTDTTTVTAKSRFDTTKSAISTLTIQEKASSAYVTSWLVNGYYSNSDRATLLSTDYIGGEANVNPTEGGLSGGKTWARMDSATNHVDLAQLYGNPTYCAAYAHAYVYSPTQQTVNMWLGSDDGIKIWLNGAVVWTNDAFRKYVMDGDKTTITLPAGWSKLLVKVSQASLAWGFSVKLCDSQGYAIAGIDYDIAPTAAPSDAPPTISNIKVTPSSTSAMVEWDTDMAADSLVDCWTADNVYYTKADWTLVTHHSITLTGLTAATAYTFTVSSTSAQGITSSADGSFQTTADTTPPPPSSGGYNRTWLINGYYPNADVGTRLSTDYLGGESAISPSNGSVSGGKYWFKTDSAADYVDLYAVFGGPTYCAAYAFAYVYSPSIQTANMWMGSNDGIEVWLNGSVAWTNDVYRSYVVDKDKTTVTLPAGWSRLLVKISQATGSWGFSFKFCDSYGNPLPNVTYALAPALPTDTTPPVISNVKVTPAGTSAVVEWDTDEGATTMLDYGGTTALGTDYWDGDMVTHHSATITGLTAGATYYVRAGSADGNGNTAWAGTYTFQTSSPYIMNWLVNGYYSNSDQATRLQKGYIGTNESYITPTAGMVSGGKTWGAYTSPYSYTDLNVVFGSQTNCAAYAYSYIYAPSAVSAYLWIGSADGVKVWLTAPAPGGPSLFTHDVYRSYLADQDKVAIPLKAGWNGILVKITKDTGDWKFSVRVCDSSGNPIPGVVYSIAP